MEQTYVDIMIQSLNKKIQVLDKIIEKNQLQKEILENPEGTVDEFDQVVEDKSALIEQLEQLDSGFDKLYDRVKEALKTDKEAYVDKIAQMQDAIRKITEKSMDIQTQESRNKDLMMQKVAFVKNTAKKLRTNKKAVSQYYQTMMQLNYVDPQFLDNKK